MDEAKTWRDRLRERLQGRLGRRGRQGLAGAAVLWVVKWAVVIAFVFAGCGPIGPIPGGALDGEVGPAVVADWSFADAVENAQLETRPGDPHSVNTWWGAVGGKLYVPTSMILGPKDPTGRSWVAHVSDDDRVRIRLGDQVFERRALRLPYGGAEYETARRAIEARYDIAVADRDPERTVWVYRLDPR
ncbi:MAG: hypothetical protein NXI30_09435 [bacterium]|nr:hypothetical protein [bacterium]